jgi:hypothetical protein
LEKLMLASQVFEVFDSRAIEQHVKSQGQVTELVLLCIQVRALLFENWFFPHDLLL